MGFFQGVLHMRTCITSMPTNHLLGFMALCGNYIPLTMRRVPWIRYMQDYSNLILFDQMYYKRWSYSTSMWVLTQSFYVIAKLSYVTGKFVNLLQCSTYMIFFSPDKTMFYDSHVDSDIIIPHQFWHKVTIFSSDNATCHACIARNIVEVDMVWLWVEFRHPKCPKLSRDSQDSCATLDIILGGCI